MRLDDWESIKHFHAGENWGDWTKMDFRFLRTLDTLRHLVDTPFELTSAAYATSGHASPSSWHSKGRAADFRCPRPSLFDAYDLLIETIKDMGIECGFGIYPDWATPGFHFDDSGKPPGDSADRWIRIDSPRHGIPQGYHHPPEMYNYLERVRRQYRVNEVNR
jgi:hypothetical protein